MKIFRRIIIKVMHNSFITSEDRCFWSNMKKKSKNFKSIFIIILKENTLVQMLKEIHMIFSKLAALHNMNISEYRIRFCLVPLYDQHFPKFVRRLDNDDFFIFQNFLKFYNFYAKRATRRLLDYYGTVF